MSDTSLNEIQPKLIKLDKSDEESGLLTNLGKKSNSNSIFVVPSQQSSSSSPSNLTTVTLVNDPQKSNALQNKITVLPINIGTQKTNQIKLVQDLASTSPVKAQNSFISSLGNNKKLIQINSSTPSSSNSLSSSPIRSSNIIINSSDKSPQSQKILTITNGLNNTGSNISNINNKIQYVKIVNTPATNTTGQSSIKITTISANNGSNNLQDGSTSRPILSSITPTTIKTIQKPVINAPITPTTLSNSIKQSSDQSSTPVQTNVLFDAINNSPNLNENSILANLSQTNKQTTTTPTTTTIQLINPTNNQSQTQSQRNQIVNPKTSIFQRIQSFPSTNQSITKTIVTATNNSLSNSTSSLNQSLDRSSNYKVLSQQFKNSSNQTVSKNNTSNSVNSNTNNNNNNNAILLNNTVLKNNDNLGLPTNNNSNNLNTTLQSKSPNMNDNDSLKVPIPTKPKSTSQQLSPTSMNQNSSSNSTNTRKPCNCTKSMCLKLYCDCFAQGSFCHDCNCINCFNTLEHEDERNKAIKLVLERNPQAFQSKIGKFTASIALSKMMPPQATQSQPSTNGIEDLISASTATEELDEIHSRHVKGCNCKKSNCLKRYCECYLAKIQCSALCKCVGCKNCDESTRTLLQLANAADMRKQQQQLEQKQQMMQQQQIQMLTQTHFLSQKISNSISSHSNGSNLFNRSLSFKQKNFGNLDLLSESQQFQLEQQQNLK